MKISFCITCKNRLFHLKQTLSASIINSDDFFEREFIVLDYNSEDGLLDWARKNLFYWEKTGVVKYLRTTTPKFFSAAHAKNIAHKNATGDILCNLDCDNFILKGFCQYVNSLFNQKRVVLTSSSDDFFGSHGCCGKIAVLKDDFYSVNGYDEENALSKGWGWDDVNFKFRVKNHNGLKEVFCDGRFNMAISHDDNVRTQNYEDKDILKTRYLSAQHLLKIKKKCDYVANKHINWGYIEDLKIGLFS